MTLLNALNNDINYIRTTHELKVFNCNYKNMLTELIKFNSDIIDQSNNYSLILRGSFHRGDANYKSDIDLGLLTRNGEYDSALNLKTTLNSLGTGKLFSVKNYSWEAYGLMNWSFSFWSTITNHSLIIDHGDLYLSFLSFCLNNFRVFNTEKMFQLYREDLFIRSCNNRNKVKHYKYRIGGIIDYEYYLLIVKWLELNKKHNTLSRINIVSTNKYYEYLKVYKYLHCNYINNRYWFFKEDILEETCFEIKKNLLTLISMI